MSERLFEAMVEAAEAREGAEGQKYRVLGVETIKDLARAFHIRPRQIELYALDHGFIPLRYLRNIGTLSIQEQRELLNSTVAVIGAGGIGSNAAEMLARMGVGTIILADPEDFEDSNLNRQTFATEENLTCSKVDAARDRLWEINCSVLVVPHHIRVTEDSLPFIIGNADIVIDALDNLPDRLGLQRACEKLSKIMIHGAIAGGGAQVMTIFPGESGLFDLYGGEPVEEESGIERLTGNPSTTPVIAAALQVHEALRILLGREPAFRGRLLFIDLDTATFEWIEPES